MKLTATYRVTAGGGFVRLWLTDQNGDQQTYLLSPQAARTLAAHLREAQQAVAPHTPEWTPSRYRIAPGTPGRWEIGAPEGALLPILFELAPGIQLELLLPPEDSARLVDQIAKARSLPSMPDKPNA